MQIYYNSLFRGWVKITAEQKAALTLLMLDGITTISGQKRIDYINNKFMVK